MDKSKTKHWNTPEGASLLKAMLGRKKMDDKDKETLARFKEENRKAKEEEKP